MHHEQIIRLFIPAALVILTACGGARSMQFTPGPDTDFRNASNAEVRDAQGQVVLNGTFVVSDSTEDDLERKAILKGTSLDADATGEVEVESCLAAGCQSQEVEFTVLNVQPGAVLRFVIDGKEFATVTVNRDGRASVERDVPLPR